MSTTIFKHYRITAEYIGNKPAPWNDGKHDDNYHNHRVTVTNTKTKVRRSFEFWGSIMQPEQRSPSDLRNAFSCFLSDAIAGEQSFEEFCGDFGYDEDSRKAEKAHRACERSSVKARQLLGEDDLYDLCNALNEQEAA